LLRNLKEKKRKDYAVTATVSDSTAGIWKRQSKCKHKAQTPPAFSNKRNRQQNKSPDTSLSQAKLS